MRFALEYAVNYLSLSRIELAMYVQYLANTYKAPNTIKNYLSGARHWVNYHAGNDLAFTSSEVQSVLKYNINKSLHVPVQAFPLEPAHIVDICHFIDLHVSIPRAVKPAILIGYLCFLRASNLLSTHISEWGGPHTIAVDDVIIVPHGLTIRIRSSKTRKNLKPVFLNVYPVSQTQLCPVHSGKVYLYTVKPAPRGPAFMLDPFTPLTSKFLVTIMRDALDASGCKDSHRVSMHSLRRGAAQAAQRGGASRQSLKDHGTWRTDAALDTYLRQ